MATDIIDLGASESKYTEIADALLGKDARERTDLDIGEINAIAYLSEMCEQHHFERIKQLIDQFVHYRMSLSRSSRAETVDVFRSLMRERPEFGENKEEEMLK